MYAVLVPSSVRSSHDPNRRKWQKCAEMSAFIFILRSVNDYFINFSLVSYSEPVYIISISRACVILLYPKQFFLCSDLANFHTPHLHLYC